MRITAITLGSYGDIMPFIALGTELKNRGHSFKLATFEEFREICDKNGLLFHRISGNSKEMVDILLGNSNNTYEDGIGGIKKLLALYPDLYNDFYTACEDSELLIYMQFGAFAYHFAEKFKIQAIRTFAFPFDPTKEYCTLMPSLKRSSWISYFGYYMCYLFMSYASINTVNEWRKRLGLNKWNIFRSYRKLYNEKILTLYQYDEVLAEKDNAWGENIFITGAWFNANSDIGNSSEYDKLNNFLKNQDDVIYIGFGSMVYSNINRLYEMIIDSIIELNLSAVLPTSYREYVLNKYPMYKEKFFFINYFPFDIFMKEFKIAIHHGGSGTTHACLKSGVPQLILAFGADQFFWGEQCYEKQIGTFPLDVKKDISKNEIKDKIVEIIRCDRFKQKAIELSKQISLHGVEDAAKIIEEYSFRKN